MRAPGGWARLLADVKTARKAGNPVSLAPETVVNLLGYELTKGGRVSDAIGLFELNVELSRIRQHVRQPLGRLPRGRRQGEGARVRAKALAALPGDKTAGEEIKQQIRESAEAKVRQLGGS